MAWTGKTGRGTVAGWLVMSSVAAVLLGELFQRPPAKPAPGVADFGAVLRAWDRETEGVFPPLSGARAELRFPRDHAAHADSPFEVWELAARVQGEGGPLWIRFRITRLAAAPIPPARASAWAANEFIRGELMAGALPHAAAVASVRSSRVALAIAGHASDPPRVWIDGDVLTWSGHGANDATAVLAVHESELSATLRLAMAPPLIGAADSELVGGPWHGYLYPWATVSGEITSGTGTRAVTGTGWLWHNWGPLPPVGGQVVFDRWFLQFDHGEALAVLQTRRRDGSAAPSQRGFRVGPDGRLEALDPAGLRVRPEVAGDGHPSAWSFAIADGETRLSVEAAAGAAGNTVTGRGWSGAVRVDGLRAGRPVAGWGIVELGAF